MEIKEILKHVDHTLLLQPSTWEEIKQICDDAMKYGTASVCIPPCYVKEAAEYMDGKMAVCTVIGFPNGNTTTATKEFETKDAIANGDNQEYYILGDSVLSMDVDETTQKGNQYHVYVKSFVVVLDGIEE